MWAKCVKRPHKSPWNNSVSKLFSLLSSNTYKLNMKLRRRYFWLAFSPVEENDIQNTSIFITRMPRPLFLRVQRRRNKKLRRSSPRRWERSPIVPLMCHNDAFYCILHQNQVHYRKNIDFPVNGKSRYESLSTTLWIWDLVSYYLSHLTHFVRFQDN